MLAISNKKNIVPRIKTLGARIGAKMDKVDDVVSIILTTSAGKRISFENPEVAALNWNGNTSYIIQGIPKIEET
jgi:NACalpha-BTF3-like transcription factor